MGYKGGTFRFQGLGLRMAVFVLVHTRIYLICYIAFIDTCTYTLNVKPPQTLSKGYLSRSRPLQNEI